MKTHGGLPPSCVREGSGIGPSGHWWGEYERGIGIGIENAG